MALFCVTPVTLAPMTELIRFEPVPVPELVTVPTLLTVPLGRPLEVPGSSVIPLAVALSFLRIRLPVPLILAPMVRSLPPLDVGEGGAAAVHDQSRIGVGRTYGDRHRRGCAALGEASDVRTDAAGELRESRTSAAVRDDAGGIDESIVNDDAARSIRVQCKIANVR